MHSANRLFLFVIICLHVGHYFWFLQFYTQVSYVRVKLSSTSSLVVFSFQKLQYYSKLHLHQGEKIVYTRNSLSDFCQGENLTTVLVDIRGVVG